MAEVLVYIGDLSNTSAKIVVRGDTAGTVSVVCNGQTFSTEVDPAIGGGYGVVNLSGLAAGVVYEDVPIMFGGLQVNTIARLPLLPLSEQDFSFAVVSCFTPHAYFYMNHLVRELAPNFLISTGDWVYSDNAMTPAWGVSADQISANYTEANYYAIHERPLRNPGTKMWGLNSGILKMQNDHELPGSNWDGSWRLVNEINVVAATQADCDGVFVNIQGWMDNCFWIGNPDSPAGYLPEKPKIAYAATPVEAYGPRYFEKVVGEAHLFVLDDTSHKDPQSGAWYTFSQTAGTTVLSEHPAVVQGANTGTVCKLWVESGSWAGGNAAGTVLLVWDDVQINNGSATFGANTITLANFTQDYQGAVITDAGIDGKAQTFLGAQQLTWLLNGLQTSTAKFKIIVSPNKMFGNASSGDDWLVHYTKERNYVAASIQDATNPLNNEPWTVPGGVVVVAGDQHYREVVIDPTYGILHITNGTAGYGVHGQEAGYTDGIRYLSWPGLSQTEVLVGGHYRGALAMFSFEGDYMIIKLVNHRNETEWAGSIKAGSNQLYYPTVRFG